MAKSVTALVFGRAMQLGLVSPDDPVGSLVPEADGPHGTITLRDLLTMTSGLRWNGLRDYNIFTMPDRIVRRADARARPPARHLLRVRAERGRRCSPRPSAARPARTSVTFAQRELMDPLGIEGGTWHWERDKAGHVAGFYGVNMRPDDFGRLGELMRRGGVWRGHRLLSEEFMRARGRAVADQRLLRLADLGQRGQAVHRPDGSPSAPVTPNRDMPDLPADLYRFSGLFGQLVTRLPVAGHRRRAHRPGPGPRARRRPELGARALRARPRRDHRPEGRAPPATRPPGTTTSPNADYGFQNALAASPTSTRKGVAQDPLPPAGPRRARAPHAPRRAHARGEDGEHLDRRPLPADWPSGEPGCRGTRDARRRAQACLRRGAGHDEARALPADEAAPRRAAALAHRHARGHRRRTPTPRAARRRACTSASRGLWRRRRRAAVVGGSGGGAQPGPRSSTCDLRPQPARGADVARERDVLVERDAHRVERLELLRQPVADALALGLPGAEQPVPDDQDPAVVLVEVLVVGAVVDAVVRRRVEHALDPRAAGA